MTRDAALTHLNPLIPHVTLCLMHIRSHHTNRNSHVPYQSRTWTQSKPQFDTR